MSYVKIEGSSKRRRYTPALGWVPASGSGGPMAVERAARRRKRRPTAYSVTKGGELKYIDTVSISVVFSTTLGATLLNSLVTGDTNKDRDGKAILVKSIYLRGRIFLNGDIDASAPDHLRMVIVYDRQSNGAAPTWASVMQSVDSGNNVTNTSFSFTNQDNTDRYQILMDKHFGAQDVVANAATTASSQLQQHVVGTPQDISFYRKVNLPTRYGSSAGGIADIQMGAIYLLQFGLIASASAAWSFQGEARLRFSDQAR